jgi:superfamily I DNA/RNA helicase
MIKKGVHPKSKDFKENMLKDEYLNALRAVFGYVLTCHKAQGGEWDKVYLDIPKNLSYRPDNTAYQWLYTAMTRAKEQLFVKDDFYLI